MKCESCNHFIAGMCEIYGDSIPEDNRNCPEKNFIEENEMPFVMETGFSEMVGITSHEAFELQCLEELHRRGLSKLHD